MANIQTIDELKTLQSKNRRKATIAISSTVILCFLFFFLYRLCGCFFLLLILFGLGCRHCLNCNGCGCVSCDVAFNRRSCRYDRTILKDYIRKGIGIRIIGNSIN